MVSAPSQPIRLALVEDHELVRIGVGTLLNGTGSIHVVGETPSATAAIRDVHDWNPDVVLMDIYLSDGNGFEVCRKIRASCPSVRILFFSGVCDRATVQAAIEGGASGYIKKNAALSQLTDAIISVAQGNSYFDGQATNIIFQLLRSSPVQAVQGPVGSLSPQEDRVVAFLAEGKTNKEIAVLLGLSDKTVKNYLRNAFDKLQITRRSQAAAMYVRNRRLAASPTSSIQSISYPSPYVKPRPS